MEREATATISGGKDPVCTLVIMDGKPNLFEIIHTLEASSRTTSPLDRGKNESGKDADDRDNNDQFDDRKA